MIDDCSPEGGHLAEHLRLLPEVAGAGLLACELSCIVHCDGVDREKEK
uniref:Uncharacterized protein n=1 Tax=Setaria viridis TaxID=4556 RepID=A0A4V6D8K2_SETVI|nr:hypothetical protein SEVIR_4G233401v2 [Setaria viridis]